MAYDWIAAVYTRSRSKGPARAVLAALAYHASRERGDGKVWPSVETLANESGLSKRTVVRALQDLEHSGEIIRTGKHVGRTVVYRLEIGSESVRAALSEVSERHSEAPEDGAQSVRVTPTECQSDTSESVRVTLPIEPELEPERNRKTPPCTSPQRMNGHAVAINDPADRMFDTWNQLARECGLAEVQARDQDRRIKARHRDRQLGGQEGWDACLVKIRGSPLLRGEVGRTRADGSRWRVTFDWLMSPANLRKVMEGNYDDRRPGAATARDREERDRQRRRETLAALGIDPDRPGADDG